MRFKHHDKMRGEGRSRAEYGFGLDSDNPFGPRFGARSGHRHRDHNLDGGFGPGGRRRRLFDSGALRLMVLQLLHDAPRHGYDLIRALDEASSGAYVPSPGMIYPLLSMLVEMDLVQEIASEGARKMLAITPAGEAELVEQADKVTALFAKLETLAQARDKTDAMPVRRAMHNLRSILMARLAQDGVSQDTIFAAVALIDDAAQKIERL